MYSSLLLLFSLLFAVDEGNIFFVVAKVAPALLSESYGYTSHTHIHHWTTSLRYQLWLWPEHMFAQREREREWEWERDSVWRKRNQSYTLSLSFSLSPSGQLIASRFCCLRQVCVCVCVGCLINKPQAFPICLYCIIAWGRFIYFINTAKQLTSFSLSLEFYLRCVAGVCSGRGSGEGWTYYFGLDSARVYANWCLDATTAARHGTASALAKSLQRVAHALACVCVCNVCGVISVFPTHWKATAATLYALCLYGMHVCLSACSCFCSFIVNLWLPLCCACTHSHSYSPRST